MSVFEIIMLVCFGAAWPVSIYKSWKSRKNGGKSIFFLAIIFAGYGAGIMNKLLYDMDAVIWLYYLNLMMVGIDMTLWLRNRRLEKAAFNRR